MVYNEGETTIEARYVWVSREQDANEGKGMDVAREILQKCSTRAPQYIAQQRRMKMFGNVQGIIRVY